MSATRKTVGWFGLLLAAALATAGCSSADARSGAAGATPAAPSRDTTLFTDSFDDDTNGWALPANEQGRSDIEGGDFVWESRTPNLRPHLLAETLAEKFDRGELRMRDVVVRTRVTPVRGKAAFGLFCREVRDTDADFQWYEFVARDGYAAIRRADSAGHLDVLAKTTELDLPLGAGATMEAACTDDSKGRAQLWLSVNDSPVLFTRDARPLGNGAPGLQAYDAPSKAGSSRLLIRWHDFTVSEPGS